jgi:hypothetical protein
MLFEERLEAAERRRLEGNTLFAEGKYKEALAKYALVRTLLCRYLACACTRPHAADPSAG